MKSCVQLKRSPPQVGFEPANAGSVGSAYLLSYLSSCGDRCLVFCHFQEENYQFRFTSKKVKIRIIVFFSFTAVISTKASLTPRIFPCLPFNILIRLKCMFLEFVLLSFLLTK